MLQVSINKVQEQIPAIQQARNREDKVMKKPEARKYSVANFNERVKFRQNGEEMKAKAKGEGSYDLEKILHAQYDDYMHGYQDSARRVKQHLRYHDKLSSDRTGASGVRSTDRS